MTDQHRLVAADQVPGVRGGGQHPVGDLLVGLSPGRAKGVAQVLPLPGMPQRAVSTWLVTTWRAWRPMLPATFRQMPQALAADRRVRLED